MYPPESGNLVQSHNSRAGQYDLFNTIETQVRNGLGNLMLDDCTDHTSTKSDSLVGGAMARALCHIHRVKQDLPLNSQLKSKIVVVSGSSDSALQYMTFMNVFFSAQKEVNRNTIILVFHLYLTFVYIFHRMWWWTAV